MTNLLNGSNNSKLARKEAAQCVAELSKIRNFSSDDVELAGQILMERCTGVVRMGVRYTPLAQAQFVVAEARKRMEFWSLPALQRLIDGLFSSYPEFR